MKIYYTKVSLHENFKIYGTILLHIAGTIVGTSVLVFRASTWNDLGWTTAYILPAALLAFMLGVSEYLLVYHTSGLTLSVSGVFKVYHLHIRVIVVSILCVCVFDGGGGVLCIWVKVLLGNVVRLIEEKGREGGRERERSLRVDSEKANLVERKSTRSEAHFPKM